MSQLIVTGSPSAYAVDLPPGTDYVKLPAVTKDPDGANVARTLSSSFASIRDMRSDILLSAARHVQPDLFIVDRAPAGLDGEALGTLRYFRRHHPKTKLIVGLAEARLDEDSRPFRGSDRVRNDATDDPKLPQLAALRDRERMAGELSAFGALEAIDLVRHKPGRRAILRYTMRHGDDRVEDLYAKTFASERGPKVFAIARAITAVQAFGADVALPEPVVFLPELKLLVQRSVRGEPVEEALLGGDVDLARRIATAFHRLHTSEIDLGRRHDLSQELAPLPDRVAGIGAVDGKLMPLASGCLEAIQREATRQPWAWRWRPIHRDAYHDQVLIDGQRLGVLDLDDAAMSEPAIDIANIVAHLQLLGIQRHHRAGTLGEVIEAFLGQALRLDPELDRALLDFLRAATLLRLAGIHVSRRDGVEVATLLLNECARMLATPGLV